MQASTRISIWLKPVRGFFLSCLIAASLAATPFPAGAISPQQPIYLKASNTNNYYQLGYSVAISGDTMVVGSRLEASASTGVNGDQTSTSATAAGAAYVFVRSGESWVQQAYLKASDTTKGDWFGFSVAIDGDTLVVGAREATRIIGANNATLRYAGVAYVFNRSGETWSQQAYLKASNMDVGDRFGESVAVSGNTVVVGAPFEGGDDSGNFDDAGAAYVFTRSDTTWTEQAMLKASNTEEGDKFGSAVTIAGDTLMVGAMGEDSRATGIDGNQDDNTARSAGAAYVFVRSGDSWSQQAYLKSSDMDSDDEFGRFLDISGETLVVGARGENSSATGVDGDDADDSFNSAGAAYIFVRSGDTWSQQAYLKASNTAPGARFGSSVSVSGDIVVVGSNEEDSNATGVNGDQNNTLAIDSGAAYVFARDGTNWSERAYLKASNTTAGDEFGWSVGISGDTLVVGAYKESGSATGVDGLDDDLTPQSGAAYIFSVPAADLIFKNSFE